MRNRRRGSTTIEFLIGCICITMLIPIIYTSMRILISHEFFNQNAQDEIALYQLRKLILLSSDLHVEQGNLVGIYDESEFEIKTTRHTFKTPGTQIYFSDIDEGFFIQDKKIIYYEYLRKGNRYKRVIGYE